MKRLAIDYKKILAKHISYRGLAFRNVLRTLTTWGKQSNFLFKGEKLWIHTLQMLKVTINHVNPNKNHNKKQLDIIWMAKMKKKIDNAKCWTECETGNCTFLLRRQNSKATLKDNMAAF